MQRRYIWLACGVGLALLLWTLAAALFSKFTVRPGWQAPAADAIAFTSDRDGLEAVYVIRTDGTGTLRVSDFDANNPAWSPDGRLLAYARYRRVNWTGQPTVPLSIRAVDADTGVDSIIWDCSQTGWSCGRFAIPRLTWGPRGCLVAVVEHSHEASRLNVPVQPPVTGGYPCQRSYWGSWGFDPTAYVLSDPCSPDDRYCLTEQWRPADNTDEAVFVAPGGVTVSFGIESRSHYGVVAWAPDAHQVAFTVWARHPTGLRVMNVDDVTPRVLTELTPGDPPSWSADSRRLVFSAGGDLWLADVAAGSVRQLTSGPANDHQPAWRPLH